MKLILQGIGPDISTALDHIEPGLRRARFTVENNSETLVEGAGRADVSIIFRVEDTADLQSAERLARQAAARFFQEISDAISDE